MTTKIDYALKLAEAKIVCRECEGKGGFTERTGVTDVDQYRCETCKGTGLVYLLPDESGVRVKCLLDAHKKDTGRYKVDGVGYYRSWTPIIVSVSCEEVSCPGFTVLDPVTGSDTWAQAVWPLLWPMRGGKLPMAALVKHYESLRIEGLTPAALGFAWKALLAAGMVREETP